MATKKDLVEAQSFSRRRLLTAFVSGAPGGRELEPTKPLRAVVAGVALTALLVLGSLGFGLLSPTLPSGWDNNSLVVTKDSQHGGSRYVALAGVLYPVLNTTSAHLVVPAGSFQVVQVSEADIAGTRRGSTIGIPGAPDDLPDASRLIGTGWLACTSATGSTATVVSDDPIAVRVRAQAPTSASAPAPGVLVESGGDQFLVAGRHRFLVPRDHADAVLRAIGQDASAPWHVSAKWLNLFSPGADLNPIAVVGAGGRVPAGVPVPLGAVVGSVLAVTDGTGEVRRYVVSATGELAALTDFAGPLYRLGSGAQVGKDIEVTAADVAGLRTAQAPVTPTDWPVVATHAAPQHAVGCAVLAADEANAGAPAATLAFSTEVAVPATGDEIRVDSGAGALVRATGGGSTTGPVLLVDQTGTTFPVPDTSTEMLSRLGFGTKDVTSVPPSWLALFRAGPTLTEAAARSTPPAAAGS